MPKASAFIGTSGFFYKHWQGVFYPETLPQKDWFGYYVRHFDTVELNVSFYRLPKKTTFENWRAKAGKKFVFAVKGSRYITHIKRLKDCQEPLARFFEAASGLHSRSGPRGLSGSEVVLWQLPPRFKANISRLGEFLRLLVTVPTSLSFAGRGGVMLLNLETKVGCRQRFIICYVNTMPPLSFRILLIGPSLKKQQQTLFTCVSTVGQGSILRAILKEN